MASSSTVTQPNTSLYINNLNDQINKEEMRGQLYALFTTYGKVIDVVASKTPQMRGQAFLVFTDLAAATSALRACDGMLFYDKPLVRTLCLLRSSAHQQTLALIFICAARAICENQITRYPEEGRSYLRTAYSCTKQCTR